MSDDMSTNKLASSPPTDASDRAIDVMRSVATPHTWRTSLAVALRRLAWRIDRSNLPLLSGGQWCIFSAAPSRFNMPAWTVRSVRGQFELGVIEWSPQWRAYRFRPAADLVCNGGMLAEVYAFLRQRGAVTGRFV